MDAIGRRFADGYYGAFVAEPAAAATDRYYGDGSRHVHLRRRRPDFLARGAREVGLYMARMRYDECCLEVKSVDTIEVRPGWLAVLTVGTLDRGPGDGPPRTFVQSTVVRHAAPPSSANREFVIVGTVFQFDDAVADDERWSGPDTGAGAELARSAGPGAVGPTEKPEAPVQSRADHSKKRATDDTVAGSDESRELERNLARAERSFVAEKDAPEGSVEDDVGATGVEERDGPATSHRPSVKKQTKASKKRLAAADDG